MNRLPLLALLPLFTLAFTSPALADGPKPIADQAPAAPPAPPAEKAKAEVGPKTPYDYGDAPRDPAAERDIVKLQETCYASPMSREGMSPADEAKCNAQVARLLSRGRSAVPAIFAALNREESFEHYYARDRLFYALGRLDDPKVREALLRGLERIGAEELDSYPSDTYAVAATLESSLGAAPAPEVPWESNASLDTFEETRAVAARWRAFTAAHKGKTRGQVVAETITRSRKGATSPDHRTAYLAVHDLMRHAPREAKRAADAYAAREGLPQAVVLAFESLSADADWRLTPEGARARF